MTSVPEGKSLSGEAATAQGRLEFTPKTPASTIVCDKRNDHQTTHVDACEPTGLPAAELRAFANPNSPTWNIEGK